MNHQTLYKYDASDLYYTKDTAMKFSHSLSCLRILRIESVRRHFLRGKYTAAMSASSISRLIIQG